jgi:predicted RNase H-like nuclease (RuvC/YqgF family)
VSDNVRPEKAFAELQQLVRHLGDELAAFRRRALQAEAKVKEFDSAGSVGSVSPQRIQKLEKENAMLNKRLNSAKTRTRQMVERARFLRQQHDGSGR